MLQSTTNKKMNITSSYAPWTMHEFFAGSGLVAYGLKGMFVPIWANDISKQKATVYEANLGDDHFVPNVKYLSTGSELNCANSVLV